MWLGSIVAPFRATPITGAASPLPFTSPTYKILPSSLSAVWGSPYTKTILPYREPVCSESPGLERRTHGCCRKVIVLKKGTATTNGPDAHTDMKVASGQATGSITKNFRFYFGSSRYRCLLGERGKMTACPVPDIWRKEGNLLRNRETQLGRLIRPIMLPKKIRTGPSIEGPAIRTDSSGFSGL
jgi:hypothetical protein